MDATVDFTGNTVPYSSLAIHDGGFEEHPADSRKCLCLHPPHTVTPCSCVSVCLPKTSEAVFSCEKNAKSVCEKHCSIFYLYVVNIVLP